MKVLLVNDYATLYGGAEIQMLTLRDGLRRRGHEVRVFASSARPSSGYSMADYECFGTTSRFRALLQSGNPWAYVGLRRALAEFRPDVVHVIVFLTQLSPLILPLLRKVPALYYIVWLRPICPVGTKFLPDGAACRVPAGLVCYRSGCLPLRDWLPLMAQMRLWQRWRGAFKLLVANSDAVRRRLAGEGIQPVEIVWHGVPARPQRRPLSLPPTVAFAGRLVAAKGAAVLLEAFSMVLRRLPDARLLIAGDGPERERLRLLATELGLSSHVTMLGHLRPEELDQQLGSAWVQVVPSLWEEGFGIVAAEAMMRGTAVLASRVGGLTEIVRHGDTGFLVGPGDAGALSDALVMLMDDRDLAERMGQAGRQVALKDFSEEAVVEKFIRLYRSLATPARAGTLPPLVGRTFAANLAPCVCRTPAEFPGARPAIFLDFSCCQNCGSLDSCQVFGFFCLGNLVRMQSRHAALLLYHSPDLQPSGAVGRVPSSAFEAGLSRGPLRGYRR